MHYDAKKSYCNVNRTPHLSPKDLELILSMVIQFPITMQYNPTVSASRSDCLKLGGSPALAWDFSA